MATGQTLTFSQIEQLWITNGGPAGWAPLMAGIAMAESGGNTIALNNNPNTGDYSVGLWQINYFGNLLPGRTNAYGSPAALQADPNLQAKAAISLFGGGPGITNWKGDATYNKWTAAGSPSQPSSATVLSWIGGGGGTSGTSSGTTATGSAASGASGVGGNDLSQCVAQLPGFLFFSGPCLITKGGVKWLTGTAALVGGGLVGIFGVLVLAAYGFQASGAKAAVAKTASALPGPAGRIVRATGSAGGGGVSTSRSRRPARVAGLGPSARPAAPPDRADRLAEREGIGPRGGNPTSARIAREQRRGTSVAGAPRRRMEPRRQATTPVRRGAGFGGRPGAPDGPQ